MANQPSSYDLEYFPAEVGNACEKHFEGHAKHCMCCDRSLRIKKHKTMKCVLSSQPGLHPSPNCQQHVQHIQNCVTCTQKYQDWLRHCYSARWCWAICAAFPVLGTLSLYLLAVLGRSDFFCGSWYLASLGNAIGPATVTFVVTIVLFWILFATGWFDRQKYAPAVRLWPQLYTFIAIGLLGVVVACVLPFGFSMVAPKFVCGRVDDSTDVERPY